MQKNNIDMVDIDRFLSSSNYVSRVGNSIYPFWKDEMRDFLSQDSSYSEWVISGSIGIGKTTVSMLVAVYKLQNILSLESPQLTLGVSSDTNLSLVVINELSRHMHSRDSLRPYLTILRLCSSFKEVFSQDELMKYQGDLIPFYHDHANNMIEFNKNINVRVASKGDDLLGVNPFAIVCDHYDHKRFLDLYVTVKEQIAVKFKNLMFCFSVIVGYSKKKDDPFEQYLNSVNIEYTKISRPSQWDVRDNLLSNNYGFFYVLNGTNDSPSSILTDIQVKYWLDQHNELPHGAQLVKVPNVYLRDFQLNVERSLQDIAGMATI